MGSLPHFFLLSLSLPLSLYIYLSISLTLSLQSLSISSLSFSLSHVDKKRKIPQSLLQIGGDQGPIETVNLAVGEDVTQILGADVCHAHRSYANRYLVIVYKPPKWGLPRWVE